MIPNNCNQRKKDFTVYCNKQRGFLNLRRPRPAFYRPSPAGSGSRKFLLPAVSQHGENLARLRRLAVQKDAHAVNRSRQETNADR